MKKTLVFIVLVAWLLNCAPTLPHYKYHVYERKNPIVISERVGETIDAQERDQLDLFTEIGEFKEARFFAIKGGGYEIEIVTESQKMHAVNIDPNAVEIMRDYIGRYAEIKGDRASFENRWAIIDYDTLGIPITENEVSIAMKQNRGRAIKRGCSGCALVSFLGLGFAAVCVGSADSGTDIGPALGVVAGAIALAVGVVIGSVTGSIIYLMTYKNADGVLKAIKEARKPRVVE